MITFNKSGVVKTSEEDMRVLKAIEEQDEFDLYHNSDDVINELDFIPTFRMED